MSSSQQRSRQTRVSKLCCTSDCTITIISWWNNFIIFIILQHQVLKPSCYRELLLIKYKQSPSFLTQYYGTNGVTLCDIMWHFCHTNTFCWFKLFTEFNVSDVPLTFDNYISMTPSFLSTGQQHKLLNNIIVITASCISP